VRERRVSPPGQEPREIFVVAHRRVTVIASHPEVHLVPPAVPLGVGTDLRDGVVHDPHRLADDGRILTRCVRRLVDSGERDERESHSPGAQAPGDFLADPAIDRRASPGHLHESAWRPRVL